MWRCRRAFPAPSIIAARAVSWCRARRSITPAISSLRCSSRFLDFPSRLFYKPAQITLVRHTRFSDMAGHSQFKNIMHRKGRQDKARARLFSKLGREITTAAKMGMPDPNFNPRLRLAIIAARAENMPKDNIERAIKKSQAGDTENYDEVRYEGYGPGGVAVIVEALTDNRNRTAGEVRSSFTKSG